MFKKKKKKEKKEEEERKEERKKEVAVENGILALKGRLQKGFY